MIRVSVCINAGFCKVCKGHASVYSALELSFCRWLHPQRGIRVATQVGDSSNGCQCEVFWPVDLHCRYITGIYNQIYVWLWNLLGIRRLHIGKIYLDCILERYMRIMTITRDKKIAYWRDIWGCRELGFVQSCHSKNLVSSCFSTYSGIWWGRSRWKIQISHYNIRFWLWLQIWL